MTKENGRRRLVINLMILLTLHLIFRIIHSINIENIVVIISIEILSLILLLTYLYKKNEINIKELLKFENLKYIVVGCIMMKAVTIVFSLIAEKYGIMRIQGDILHGITNNLRDLSIVEYYIVSILWIPIIEEFQYRYIFIGEVGNVSNTKNVEKSMVILSTVLYAFSYELGSPLYCAMYLLIGIIPAIIYYKTKIIDVCIATSMIYSVLNIFL